MKWEAISIAGASGAVVASSTALCLSHQGHRIALGRREKGWKGGSLSYASSLYRTDWGEEEPACVSDLISVSPEDDFM